MKTQVNDKQIGCTICAKYRSCDMYWPHAGIGECYEFEPAEGICYFTDDKSDAL